MGGHDGKNSGWGKRDQDFGDPKPDPALDAKPDSATDELNGTPGLDRGAVPGAHGDRAPHQEVKPGTKLDIEKGT